MFVTRWRVRLVNGCPYHFSFFPILGCPIRGAIWNGRRSGERGLFPRFPSVMVRSSILLVRVNQLYGNIRTSVSGGFKKWYRSSYLFFQLWRRLSMRVFRYQGFSNVSATSVVPMRVYDATIRSQLFFY